LEFINDFYVFLVSVLLISLSGVLMPGPLFAMTITKASKSKIAGALIAVGHGIVEFPLIILIFFVLSQFEIPRGVQVTVGLLGGLVMIFMGMQAFRKRHRQEESTMALKRDSIFAGVWTTAVNAGFILWWLTIGTTLILNAKLFQLAGFAVFAGVHWLTDFLWYSIVGLLIFKSQKFWSQRTRMGITLFCVAVFIGFGAFFIALALWSILT
jgi:threonine/homoserine/homoserine lactone efflux protein